MKKTNPNKASQSEIELTCASFRIEYVFSHFLRLVFYTMENRRIRK